MKCNKCGKDNEQQMSFCTVCGESLKNDDANIAFKETQFPSVQGLEKSKICHICNTKITEDTIYCHLCGSRQNIVAQPKGIVDGFSFENSSDSTNSKGINSCAACGENIPPGTTICAACVVSQTALPGSFEKPEIKGKKAENEGAKKLDAKQIEPMIAMITKMRPVQIEQATEAAQLEAARAETGQGKAGEAKTEQNAVKDKRINENKSNIAQEFLPAENAKENLLGQKPVKPDKANLLNTQPEKTQKNSETSVPKNDEASQYNSSKPKTVEEKENSAKGLGDKTSETKEDNIKTQNTKPEEKQPAQASAEPENRTSQWKSVQIPAGTFRETSALIEPVLPPSQSEKQLAPPKRIDAPADTAPAKDIDTNRAALSQQGGEQRQLSNWKNAPAQTVSGQPAFKEKIAPLPPTTEVAAQQQTPVSGRAFALHQPSAPIQTATTEPYGMPPAKKTTQKGKKAVFAVLVVMIVVMLGAAFSVYYMIRSSNYDEAVQYMDDGQYAEAYDVFKKLGNYKDAAENAAECYKFLRYDEAVELMNDAKYEDAAERFSELGEFKDSEQLYNICTMFCDAINHYNDGRYWKAYSTFENLNGYGDSEEWMGKCIQEPPGNGVAEKGDAHAEGTAKIKIVNATEIDAFFVINTIEGHYWGGIYIHAGTDATVTIAPGEYSADLAVGTKWFGTVDMFGRGQDSSYQQNVEVDEQGNTSFLVMPNKTKAFTIYS